MSLTEDQERQRSSWQYRAILATQGQRTQLGTILLAVLGYRRETRSFGGCAGINEDGWVVTDFRDREGQNVGLLAICTASQLRDEFSRLSDHLKLTDAERIELFNAVRSWITLDYRAQQDAIDYTALK